MKKRTKLPSFIVSGINEFGIKINRRRGRVGGGGGEGGGRRRRRRRRRRKINMEIYIVDKYVEYPR